MPACRPLSKEAEEHGPQFPEDGCAGFNCKECIWVTTLCPDCAQYGNCRYQYLPKILPINRYALSLYPHMEKGNLPLAGGVLDQPHKLLQLFDIIRSELKRQDRNERLAKGKE